RAAYTFWTPMPATVATALVLTAPAANAGRYAEALLGLSQRGALYPVPAAILATIGLGVLLRSPQRNAAVSLVCAAALHTLLALGYFFRDPRFLLPVAPLIMVFAAAGLRFLWTRSRGLAGALAATALALQLNALGHRASGGARMLRLGVILPTVAAVLPSDAFVVSDVAAPLAWLYWIRGTRREFMPMTVPPDGVEGNLIDTPPRPPSHLSGPGLPPAAPPSTLL